MDDDFIVKIDLKKLVERVNPFDCLIWYGLEKPLTIEEIQQAINENWLLERESDHYLKDIDYETDKEKIRNIHIQRIAWLVQNWNDNHDPIEMDFGVPELGYPTGNPILDGCHRLASAIFKKKPYIAASCSGSFNEINRFIYENKANI